MDKISLEYLFLIYLLQLYIICSYLQHSLESSKVFFFHIIKLWARWARLNILSNIRISCILEDIDMYVNIIITFLTNDNVELRVGLTSFFFAKAKLQKTPKSDLFYSWGPKKVISLLENPDFEEVIFLWDSWPLPVIFEIQITQILEVI